MKKSSSTPTANEPWQSIREKSPSADLMADQEERDFRVSLRTIEKRAILPLKWTIFLTAVVFWGLSHPYAWPPPVSVFTLFTATFMFNVGASYFLLLNRVTLRQIRAMSVISYYADVLFVTLLIYLESALYPAPDAPSTDFYIYYFILVLRSFALFRTAWGNLAANAVVALIFIWSLFWQNADLLSYAARNNLVRVVFIWIIILMSWYIVQIINRQKTELLRTREKLVQSENLALVGELAAGVAHEINNPIGIISTYSDFLARSAEPDDERLKDYKVIHDEARRCEAIVKELLTYARPAGRDLVPLDLARLNDEVLDFVEKQSGQRTWPVAVSRDYAQNVPWPVADPAQLKQALLNIYLNAFQALDTIAEARITSRIYHDGRASRVVIEVQDNGPGIAPEDLRRIFDPFFTTRARGTGLGLSITRRLIEAGGGEVRVQSKKSGGTTVQLSLPVDEHH